jgi:hypothetical protein
VAKPTAVTDWLFDSDPALRWQVERDLLGAPREVWAATRARIAAEGFGAALLALRDPDGRWAGDELFPRHFEAAGPETAQPWTTTMWTLNTLRDWGLDAAALTGNHHDVPDRVVERDCCRNGYTLANGAWLGADVSAPARWFLDNQLADGGWNCDPAAGRARSSFHSTLNVLEALLYFEVAVGADDAVRAARRNGAEYLLRRRLLHRVASDELVGPWVTTFAYPFRWQYSALKAVDYFYAAAQHDRVPPDRRLADAIGVIRAAGGPDGRWRQGHRHPGKVWFEVDVAPGEPSKWLTFYATRALAWWDRTNLADRLWGAS